MPKLKVKQLNGTGQTLGAVVTTDGSGNTIWAEPVLGTPGDGSWTNSWYSGGPSPAVQLNASLGVSTAIDDLNSLLGLFMPYPPTQFGGTVLTLSTSNTTALLAAGYTKNDPTVIPVSGSAAIRITTSSAATVPTPLLGSGMSGVLSLYENSTLVPSEILTFDASLAQVKSTGVLRVGNINWSGTSPSGGSAPNGFYMSFQSSIVGSTVLAGYNTFQIDHSLSGNSAVLAFCYDTLTATPTVATVSVVQATEVATVSSGLTCYAAGSTFTIGATVNNLAGQMYSSGTILSITGPGTTENFAAGQAGLPGTLAVNTTNFTMTPQVFTVGGNVQSTTSRINLAATNPNGSGNTNSGTNLMILSGSGGIQEPSISGPATTNRVYMNAANNASDTPSSLTYTAWNSSTSLITAGYTQEATIVGGKIFNDTTNWSTGYLPAGNPNYSSKNATQYVTYMFAIGSKSNVAVTVTGSYSGLWVALPGLSDNSADSPNAAGGAWWDGFTLYNGSGFPGRAGQTAGCASGTVASGGSGTFTLTFGAGNSSNSTSNRIFVRFKLTSGQSITALSLA
jgi:hypothetical protein